MYWIQEIGSPGMNRADQKLFYAEKESDLEFLPNLTTEGNKEYSADKNVQTLKYGDQVLCLEIKKLYVLQTDNTWVTL